MSPEQLRQCRDAIERRVEACQDSCVDEGPDDLPDTECYYCAEDKELLALIDTELANPPQSYACTICRDAGETCDACWRNHNAGDGEAIFPGCAQRKCPRCGAAANPPDTAVRDLLETLPCYRPTVKHDTCIELQRILPSSSVTLCHRCAALSARSTPEEAK